jgi:hypothetical protein
MMDDNRLDDLMRLPGFAAYQGPYYGAILNLRLNGKRIGLLPPHLGLNQTDRAETIAVGNVLVCKGIFDANLIKRERPDFDVVTFDSRLYVEHTRVFPGCQSDSAEFARNEVGALMSDAEFAANLGHQTAVITIDHSAVPVTPIEAVAEPCPLEHVSKNEARAMVREIQDLAATGFFSRACGGPTIEIKPHEGKTLAKYRAECVVGVATSPQHVGLSLMTRRFMPGKVSLFEVVQRQIEKKRADAREYLVTPDWLVVQVVQQADEFSYDLGEDTQYELSPYRKVLVVHWHAGQPYVAEWTAEPDGNVSIKIPDLPEIVQPSDEPLPAWARRVYDALDRSRIQALRENEPHRQAEMTLDPLTVQWYRKWMGPNPWVMCSTHEGMIRMRFWIAGDWEGRETIDVDPDDIEAAAERIWNFLNPSKSAAVPV